MAQRPHRWLLLCAALAAAGARAQEPKPDDGGDVVEKIEDPEAGPARPAPEKPLAAPALSESAAQTSVRGFAIGLGEAGLANPPSKLPTGDPSPLNVPYDRLTGRAQLFLELKHAKKGVFEAVASGLASYEWLDRESPVAKQMFDNLHGSQSRGAWEPQLRELYAGVFSKYIDVRVGQQRLAWGRADHQSPNDVVNALDRRDPFLLEQELQHIPTPLARVDIDLGAIGIQLVGSPLFVPDRFDIYGSNWALVQPGSPAVLRGLLGLGATSADPSLHDALLPLFESATLPKGNLTEPTGGARISAALPGGVDLDAYYHYGFDGLPNIQIDPRAAVAAEHIDLTTANAGTLLSMVQQLGGLPLSMTYVRRHHLGFDAQTTLGPIAVRLDVAHDSAKVFYRQDLNAFISRAVTGVLSLEYQTGDIGRTVIVEVIGEHLRDWPPPGGGPLLLHGQDNVSMALLKRWTFAEVLELEMRALYGFKPLSYMVRPQVALKLGTLWLRAGAVVVGGDDGSIGGYFERNKSVYLSVKQAL
jgi:hypothetical protein